MALKRVGPFRAVLSIFVYFGPERISVISILWLAFAIWKLELPLTHGQCTVCSAGVNPFLMAFTAFLIQLAVVLGIVYSLQLLTRSGNTRRSNAGPTVQGLCDCGVTWMRICAVCCASYLSLALDVFPAVRLGTRWVFFVRIAEWIYTVPLMWEVFARTFSNANEQEISELACTTILMLTIGYVGVFCCQSTALYSLSIGVACSLFLQQAKMLWQLRPHEIKAVQALGRVVFIVSQSIEMLYPIVWLCGDLGLISPATDQIWIYTILDVVCKLVVVWGCIALRFYQAFPALSVSFLGNEQFLNTAHDVRLVLDSQLRISAVHGNNSLLHSYLGPDDVLNCNFLEMLHGESERRKFTEAVKNVDKAGRCLESPSPKLTLALTRSPAETPVTIDCVPSSAQNGFRLVAITFKEVTQFGCAWESMTIASASKLDDSASCRSINGLTMERKFSRSLTPKARLSRSRFSSKGSEKAMSQCSVRTAASYISVTSQFEHIEWTCQSVGCLLDDVLEPAFLADVLSPDYPIVGASRGFLDLSQYDAEDLIGTSVFFMEDGIPNELLSKSTKKDFISFCQACRLSTSQGLTSIGDLHFTQLNRRQDQSTFVNACICSLVMLKNRPYILGIPSSAGEGPSLRLPRGQTESAKQKNREVMRKVRGAVLEAAQKMYPDVAKMPTCWDEENQASVKGPRFYSDNLESHCILLNGDRTAIRREPYEIPNGCLVISQTRVPWRGGLRFSVVVDDVMRKFNGLPLMGFTRRVPSDDEDCYPMSGQCMGSSVSIGRCGEAFARDQLEHAVLGFKRLPEEELRVWCPEPDKPAQLRKAPCQAEPGDVLECFWMADGRLQMTRNGVEILSFDIERRPDENTDYYALIDVCFGVSQVTFLPFPEEDIEEQKAPLEDAIRGAVLDLLAHKAINEVVSQCNFCVTVADPRQEDSPLIAVSPLFQQVTGYDESLIIGRNCRFLNHNVDLDPVEIAALRKATADGTRVTLQLTNRRRSGELFINLLDLCGLRVAKDLDTGEDIWYLIGVQADITDLADEFVPKHHMSELEAVSSEIRRRLAEKIREVALDGDNTSNNASTRRVRVLDQPEWMGTVSSSEDDRAPPVVPENVLLSAAPGTDACLESTRATQAARSLLYMVITGGALLSLVHLKRTR